MKKSEQKSIALLGKIQIVNEIMGSIVAGLHADEDPEVRDIVMSAKTDMARAGSIYWYSLDILIEG